MAPPSPLDAAIDRLYQLPLDEFVAARNDLARQSRGHEAQAIRALAKPNIVAWAINQVYWSARPAFDRLVEAAGHLREAQASGLLGRPADLRGAESAHRQALRDAIKQAMAVLDGAGHEANPDTLRSLTAAFEALPWKDAPGRIVRPPSSPGFAAFADMAIAPPSQADATRRKVPVRKEPAGEARGEQKAQQATRSEDELPAHPRQAREARQEAKRAAEDQSRERQKQACEAIDRARREAGAAAERLRAQQEQLARSGEAERSARERLEETRRRVKDAESAVRDAERGAAAADSAVRKAEAAAARLLDRR